ncbi:glycosyltransferase [Verrucomicrobiales bacterium]|nr:glycosyltransferase [Verrucomicrobiales bacterium]
MKEALKRFLPDFAVNHLSVFRQKHTRAWISNPSGSIKPGDAKTTFLMAVGPAFDQRRPDAMAVCRMGYCRAFEEIGIPYVLVDVREIAETARNVPSPFVMYFAGDVTFLPQKDIPYLSTLPSSVWVYPWFEESEKFFNNNGLNPEIWTLSKDVVNKVLGLKPRIGFTATVPSGLNFFNRWEQNGVPIHSLPLACDTALYRPSGDQVPEFDGIELAFVGGYWQSKGVQLDEYLRQFEDQLKVFGYSKWPYRGYSGKLDADLEPALYRQAKVCPVINEPTVKLMKGQINERVFKAFGSGGCAISDDVPAYRELYREEELLVSRDPAHFSKLVRELMNDQDMNQEYRKRGLAATLSRHTYGHRVKELLGAMELRAGISQVKEISDI